jgi:hypothetical protein
VLGHRSAACSYLQDSRPSLRAASILKFLFLQAAGSSERQMSLVSVPSPMNHSYLRSLSHMFDSFHVWELLAACSHACLSTC